MSKGLNSINTLKWLLFIVALGAVVLAVSIFYRYSYQQEEGQTLLENQAAWILETVLQVAERELVSAGNAERTFSDEFKNKFKLAVQIAELSNNRDSVVDSIKSTASFDLFWIGRDFNNLNQFLSSNSISSIGVEDRFKASRKNPGNIYLMELESANNPIHIGLLTYSKKGIYLLASVSSDRLLKSGQVLGFGQYLKQFQKAQSIEYIVLQDKNRIIAGSFGEYNLTSFQSDSVLRNSINSDSIIVRTITLGGKNIVEAIGLFEIENEKIGVFRCGLSTSILQEQQSKFVNRLVVLGSILLFILVVLIFLFRAYRQRESLENLVIDLNEYSSRVLNQIDSGVVTFDGEGSIKLFTTRAINILGLASEKIKDPEIELLPKEIMTEIKGIISSDRPDLENKKIDVWVENNEKLLSFQISKLPPVRSVSQYALLITDTTEQHRMELEKQRREKLEAISQLGSIVAHEIRNPLNAMKLTLSNMLRLKKKDSDDTDLIRLNTINNEIDRIDSLVEDFVQYTQPQKTNRIDVRLGELFEELRHLYEGHKEKNGLNLEIVCDSDLICFADPRQLKQMLINLINNSIDAVGENGEISVSAEKIGDRIVLKIKDNGTGIEKEKLDRIFDLYYTSKTSGNGIGLAVVKQIINNHNGTINIESQPGTGTTFEIIIENKNG